MPRPMETALTPAEFSSKLERLNSRLNSDRRKLTFDDADEEAVACANGLFKSAAALNANALCLFVRLGVRLLLLLLLLLLLHSPFA